MAYSTRLDISVSVMYPSPLTSAWWRPRAAIHQGIIAPRDLNASFNSALSKRPSPFLSCFTKIRLSSSATFSALQLPPQPPLLSLPSHCSSSSLSSPLLLPFASVSQSQSLPRATPAASSTLSSDYVAKTLAGTSVYTVSNSNNEFVLISDPNGAKSIGLLCFRREDAEAFLAQVRSRRGGFRGEAKVVPIPLEHVYMLKVEGIAFQFLPDPVQIKNAVELKASDVMSGFDGVPAFQVRNFVGQKITA